MEKINPKDYKILLVDDDIDIIEFLSYNLTKEGFALQTANSGDEALEKIKSFNPHLIILDVMMPGKDGIETCELIREMSNGEDFIILMLTARGEDYSQIAGFEAGADDYITKPVKPKVLISRIYATLRRSAGKNKLQNNDNNEQQIIVYREIEIDKRKYLIRKNGEELILPRKEFELLALLCSKPGNVFTRDEIYDTIWGEGVVVGDRTIDVHIRKIREKIGGEYIKTVKGVGYKAVL